MDTKKLEVVEIAVPQQWLVYQSLLATMERIYYLDVPPRYEELAKKHPELFNILPFASFFDEFNLQQGGVAQKRLV